MKSASGKMNLLKFMYKLQFFDVVWLLVFTEDKDALRINLKPFGV